MTRSKQAVQEQARAQADLYKGAASRMDWDKYCAATSAFYSTSALIRPCHSYEDKGRREDGFHMDLAIRRGVVFG